MNRYNARLRRLKEILSNQLGINESEQQELGYVYNIEKFQEKVAKL